MNRVPIGLRSGGFWTLIGQRAVALWHACAASRTCGGGGDRVSSFALSPAAALVCVRLALPSSPPSGTLSPACSSSPQPLTSADTHPDTSSPAGRPTRCPSSSTHGLLRAERRLLRGTRGPHRAAGHRQDGESGAPDPDPSVALERESGTDSFPFRLRAWSQFVFPLPLPHSPPTPNLHLAEPRTNSP